MIYDQPIHQEEDNVLLKKIDGKLHLCRLDRAKIIGKPGDIICFGGVEEELEYSVIFD